MPNLKLSLACAEYDHIRPLKDGRVKPEGIDLDVTNLPVHEVFWRMLKFNEYDISEMSTSNYLTDRCKENPRFIAIPVFTCRIFRHGYIFINKKAGIKAPQDLKHKRIGIAEYSMTALVWVRGLLQHDYGVVPSDVEWYVGGQEGRHRKDRMKVNIPGNIRLHEVPEEKSLSDMLVSGEIDAMMHAEVPACIWEKHPDVDRLWSNYREVEKEYYRRTKIFHIMHTVVIKKEIYDANPWVARSMYEAFCEAKKVCQYAIKASSASPFYMLPWTIAEYESTVSVMGEDYWPYGVEANRPTLEAITQYAYEQGLVSRKLSLEELFAVNA